MKRLSLFLSLLFPLGLTAQPAYFQQRADFTIEVSLNDTDHTLTAFESIRYTNNSPDTLRFVWFHLWPEAYRNDKTAFSDQLLGNGSTAFYFSNKDQKGYINRLDFKVDGTTAETEDHPSYIDVIKLVLPKPLFPGKEISITTPFHVRLPQNFSRGGHVGQAYQVTQWYPKPAVYDRKGWHPMPYLDQGEFYSEYGDYDVRISVPDNYVVAATGELQNAGEIAWLTNRLVQTYSPYKPLKKGKRPPLPVTNPAPASSATFKELRYIQKSVHDFAWFADKRFLVSQDTMLLPDKRIINLSSFYLPEDDSPWPQSIGLMKAAITVRSNWLVPYPYQSIKAVELPSGNGGGMEYPTMAAISPVKSVDALDQILSHEIGHNWFYSLVGSNERNNAWLDEGINTYYDKRYDDSLRNGKAPSVKKPGIFTISGDLTELLLQTLYKKKKDQAISTSSEKFSEDNYYLIAYTKGADFIKSLESTLGAELFDSVMRAYTITWSNRHPGPGDFQDLFETVSGRDLSELFEKLDAKGNLYKPVFKRYIKPAFVLNLNNGSHYNYISAAPLLGLNAYDGLMLGGIIHNYQLPPTNFQFFVLPLYGTKTKKMNGFGGLAYNWFPGSSISQIKAGVTAARFTVSEFGSDENKLFQRFQKIAPYLKISFAPSTPRSSVEKYILFKTFMIKEDELSFGQQIVGPDTVQTVGNISQNRLLNQLSFYVADSRVLYPYSADLVLEQQQGFLRAGLTGKYYFNYSNGVNGLDLRFFAGKFFYLGDRLLKSYNRDRYFLNMSGANGYEDYTYSNYFYGRNKFEGFSTQQMMIRDGAFKVRTDLLSNKIGKTDDWLMAANFATGIPDKVNPLSVLPFKFPISVFVDIGTYSEAWKKDAESEHFLYDAGLQVSLFKQTVQIYFPLIYSKVFKDYFRSTLGPAYFWKTISFSINIQDFSLKKIFNSDAF